MPELPAAAAKQAETQAMRKIVNNQEQLRAALMKIADIRVEKPLEIIVKPWKRPRTLEQNAKLHAMFRDLAVHTGHTEADIKEYMKLTFGPSKTVVLAPDARGPRHGRRMPKGTSEYSVDELAEMIERTYQVGADVGCEWSEDPAETDDER